MKETFRQSMAWLHTWTGLVPGWVLFIIFLFGTTAFFQQEISRWMRPELTRSALSSQAIDAAERVLKARGAGADSWSLSLPDERDGDGFGITWVPKGGTYKDRKEVTLDPGTGREVAVRDTRGGFFLYRMHFDLHYMPVYWARYIVSIAALAMLVAILSGVVTHKKIFTDFFLLRFGKGQRSWLDAHNVTAVLALPFHLMITYTGLVTLLFTLMPWAIAANFPSTDAFYEAAYPSRPKAETNGQAAVMMPLRELVSRAAAEAPGMAPSYVSIDNPGDANATMEVYMRSENLGGSRGPVHLNAVTGQVANTRDAVGGARATQNVMIDLHTGHFSGLGLRWLYFLSGLGGTIMVASGLVLWTVKRRAKLPDPARPHFGFRLVERLNIGFVVGAPAGIAAYFLANRLLPVGMTDRGDWEINSLFIVWGGIFVWGLGRPARRAWLEGLLAGGLLYALIPFVNMVTTTRGIPASIMAGDMLFVSFDLLMFATAAAFVFTARKVARHQPKVAGRRKGAALQEAVA